MWSQPPISPEIRGTQLCARGGWVRSRIHKAARRADGTFKTVILRVPSDEQSGGPSHLADKFGYNAVRCWAEDGLGAGKQLMERIHGDNYDRPTEIDPAH